MPFDLAGRDTLDDVKYPMHSLRYPLNKCLIQYINSSMHSVIARCTGIVLHGTADLVSCIFNKLVNSGLHVVWYLGQQ